MAPGSTTRPPRAPLAGGGASTGYAASVLKEMYGNNLPRAAEQLLKDHAKARSASLPPQRAGATWTASTFLGDRKSDRKRVDLKVPRVGQRRDEEQLPAKQTLSRRPLEAILQETRNYADDGRKQATLLPQGRDNAAEKQRLQEIRTFGAELSTVSGPQADVPDQSPSGKKIKKVSFSLPVSRQGSPKVASGLSKEQERMATDILEGAAERQRELQGVESKLASFVDKAEAPGGRGPGGRDALAVRKEMADASKRRLELKNAIERDVKDLATLFDIAP